VVLLHGWPYDIHSYVEVAPLLASAGYRVIVPYLRGYGTTRFLSSDTPRNGQQAALAADTIALMDALAIDKAIVAGFDWGSRTANIVSALWPAATDRVRQRISDRQPRRRIDHRCRPRQSSTGGTSTTSRPTEVATRAL
jgi:pimeloyl-ACP methyl ester carboxylesterase